MVFEVARGQVSSFLLLPHLSFLCSAVKISKSIFHGRKISGGRLSRNRRLAPERIVGFERHFYVDFTVFFLSKRLITLNIIGVYY